LIESIQKAVAPRILARRHGNLTVSRISSGMTVCAISMIELVRRNDETLALVARYWDADRVRRWRRSNEMADFILFMHDDGQDKGGAEEWDPYLEKLRSAGVMRGGSAIGSGLCVRREGPAPKITGHIAGFVRVEARDLDHAKQLLIGNPVFEAGGTIEIRELPRTD